MASDRGKRRPSTTAAFDAEAQRAGQVGSRDRAGHESAAKKRSGKPASEGLGGIADGGYAEQSPRARKPPP
ncbi:MAG TPA: hypothetical protein VFL14_04560 [Xanthomonadales bacterium]|nr:hypothetical protein [Xanthomonadales bacterium]